MTDDQTDLTALTVDLLSAFVSHNNVRSDDLAGLIQSTHAALSGLAAAPGAEEEPAAATEYTPAVSARKSLGSREHIISMIDGKPYRSLKRHLSSKGLTFDEYKARYNLPDSYPSVAPGYSEARSEVAKRLGLGRKPKAAVDADPAEPIEPAAEAPKAPRRGRPPRAKAAEAGE